MTVSKYQESENEHECLTKEHLQRLKRARHQFDKFLEIISSVWMFRGFRSALEVRAFVSASVTSPFSSLPPERCTHKKLSLPSHPHNWHSGISPSQSSFQSMLQCRRLNCKVTRVFTQIHTSRTQLKSQKHLRFAQRDNSAQKWNYINFLAETPSAFACT